MKRTACIILCAALWLSCGAWRTNGAWQGSGSAYDAAAVAITGGIIDGVAIGNTTPVTAISTSGPITSTVTTGTAPLVIASTTKVTNLNADLLDGLSSAAFVQNAFTTIDSDAGTTTANANADTLTITGAGTVSTAIVGDTLTITGVPGASQDLWATVVSDAGSTTADANADTITITGGGIVTTAIVGDILTITGTEVDGDASNELQNLFAIIGSDSGTTTANAQADTLTLTGGEGIDTSIAGDVVTIAGEDASDVNKGIASFAAADFTVTAGAVALDYTNSTMASATDNGFLSNTDWSTFNNKMDGPLAKDIVTTAPLTVNGTTNLNDVLPGADADVTFAINDAAADGATKGAATFVAVDFTATAGVISLDYTNSTMASATDNGFLSAANWSTFNGKLSAVPDPLSVGTLTATSAATVPTTTVSGPLSLQGSSAIPCATGYTLTTGTASYIRVVGNGGAATGVNLADGTVDGQLLTVQGTSDANVVCITQGSNCAMADGTPITLRDGDSISYRWDNTGGKWRELNATGVARGLKTFQLTTSMADAYDITPAVRLVNLDSTVFPHGIIITGWRLSCSADDPTTEIDANLVKWTTETTTGWPTPDMTTLFAIDSTTGNASGTGLTIDVAAGQSIGIDFDADPADATTWWTFEFTYYYQN